MCTRVVDEGDASLATALVSGVTLLPDLLPSLLAARNGHVWIQQSPPYQACRFGSLTNALWSIHQTIQILSAVAAGQQCPRHGHYEAHLESSRLYYLSYLKYVNALINASGSA
ncbi:hypothetical protein GN244_ATG00674 [Phytophthora infestans]|uniref:Uncharacterized protein n=1 Tax=Phytophthora infestans TaxID=4787 RepID=A0A833T3A4_PHYIN|nr:hypothetical protein GN244_ATG00674 [Phytophthora infestans]KAF4136232.1 hypothetical protein GN958_ATG14573 [Phytophthora infestans]